MHSHSHSHRHRRTLAAVIVAALAASATLVGASSAIAAEEEGAWETTAPAGEVSATLSADAEGSLSLVVSNSGSVAVSAQSLGITTEAAAFTTGLSVTGQTEATVADSYTMTTGKQLERSYEFAESTFDVTNAEGDAMQLVVRAADDGVAYRYVLPGDEQHVVTGESGLWTLPSDGGAWLQDAYSVNYESDWSEFTTSTANGNREVGYPALFEAGENYVLLTESDNTGQYSGTHLTHEPGALSYGIELFNNEPVVWDGPLSTPWRTAIVGSLAEVTESNLVDDLATPNQLDDTSWVTPGVSSWSWLTDSASPRSEERQRDFVDLAARNGWEYVLLDEGWDAEWVPRITEYANSKGVDTIAWFHSRDLQTQEQRDEWLPRLKSWGVAGMKVDFMDTDSQDIFGWYSTISAQAAANELMINFHGSTLPRGLQRTYPNIMSYESVRGEENGMSPERSLIIPFVRNVVGSMDFTPVVFSRGSGNSSKAQEVAMSVVYESGWQHMADNPESYASEPIAEEFLQNVPTVWNDTRLVSGSPGENIVLARQSGDAWFFGGMQNGEAGSLELPLSVLGDGEWLIDTVTDAAGDSAPSPSALASASAVHTSDEVLSIPTAANGGFVAMACPAVDGRTSCYESVDGLAKTKVRALPTTVDLEAGQSTSVEATFEVQNGEASVVSLDLPDVGGFTVDGDAVTAENLGNGETLTGKWTLTANEDAAPGTVSVPVEATYTSEGEATSNSGVVIVTVVPEAPTADTYISDIETWLVDEVGFGENERDTSNSGSPILLGDTVYEKGIGAHAPSTVEVWLGASCTAFTSTVGLDLGGEQPEQGSVAFEVLGDGVVLAETDVLRANDVPVDLDVDVTGVNRLTLIATDGGDGKNNDHANWASALVECSENTAGDSVVIETTPAEPTGDNGWYLEPVTVTLSAEDPSLGDIQHRVNGGNWAAYVEPFVVSAEGSNLIETRQALPSGSAGSSARLAADTATILIDLAAPTIAFEGLADGESIDQGAGAVVSWSTADTGSGAADSAATLNGDTVDGQSLDIAKLSAGEYALSVSVTDAAGRDSSASLAFTVIAADTPGTPPGDGGNGDDGANGDNGGDLASTGVTVGAGILIALLTLIAGAALLFTRRRAHTR